METATLYRSCAPEEKLVELSTIVGGGGEGEAQLWYDGGDTVEMVSRDETARVRRMRCRVPIEARLNQAVG